MHSRGSSAKRTAEQPGPPPPLPMKASEFLISTLKEAPADAEVVSTS